MRTFVLFVCAVLLAPTLHAQKQEVPPAPAIRIGEKAVTLTGLTPGGNVALFMMSREPDVFITRSRQQGEWLTANEEGAAEYAPDFAIPIHSVWALVDVASGAYAIACGFGDCKPFERTIDRTQAVRSAVGTRPMLEIPAQRADVFLIRPKSGVWIGGMGDGGETDEDGKMDGKATLSLEKFESFREKTPPPGELQKGDLLIVFQPLSLRFSVIGVSP